MAFVAVSCLAWVSIVVYYTWLVRKKSHIKQILLKNKNRGTTTTAYNLTVSGT